MAATEGKKFYNASALAKDGVGTATERMAVAAKAGVSMMTLNKVLAGDPNVQLTTLIKVIEATGADYSEVFDAKLYNASRSAGNN